MDDIEFGRMTTRRAEKSMARKRANAQVQLEKAVARAQELGVEMRPLPPTLGGSVKGAARALVGPAESWGIAHQLLQGAMDPENPRQLDFISRLKEWIDGLETQKSETSSVQKRVVLNLGGTGGDVRDVVPLGDDGLRARCEALEGELAALRARLLSAGDAAESSGETGS